MKKWILFFLMAASAQASVDFDSVYSGTVYSVDEASVWLDTGEPAYLVVPKNLLFNRSNVRVGTYVHVSVTDDELFLLKWISRKS